MATTNKENWSARTANGKCHDSDFSADYKGEFWTTTSAPIVDENGRTVALVVDLNDSLTRDQFDRRMDLIAAAPDLLAALKSIVEMNPALPMGMLEAAEQAIARTNTGTA